MTKEELTVIWQALSDAVNLIACNCAGECQGDCTHALALKGIRICSREKEESPKEMIRSEADFWRESQL